MSGRAGVHMLVDIVVKGGNLLLNIAPTPEGTWQQGAYDLLKEFGGWMSVNGEAIYNSNPIAPYKEGNVGMTRHDNGAAYFIYLAEEGENKIPSEIEVKSKQPASSAKVSMLGSKTKLKWKKKGNGFVVTIPASLRNNPPSDYAWTIKVTELKQ